MDLELTDKIVLITGGTGGIGKAIVEDFLKEGANVICLIRNEQKKLELIAKLQEKDIPMDHLEFYFCDLMDSEDMKSVSEKILKDKNKVEILINCAGATEEYPFALQSVEQIDRMVDLNLKSPMHLTQCFLKSMFNQKRGCIINISSLSAVLKGRGIVSYAAAKAGIETFTRSLANEVGKKNIRVNCIRPGLIQTNMSEAVVSRSIDYIKSSNSLCRVGLPNEVSKAALFLASEVTASYITGECLTVDGGMY